MKTKVQAQRKFAQGAFVPPTPVVTTERRTIEPPPEHEVKVINHANISAKKILDSVTFSHPGMHLHSARVVLKRLKYTSFKSGSLVVTPSTSTEQTTTTTTEKRTRTRKPKSICQNKSTRILRSMRKAMEESATETNNSDDDRPLTYHLAKKGNDSRKRKPTAKIQRQNTASCTVSKKRKQMLPAKQSRVPVKQSRKKRLKEPHGEENSVTQCLNGVCTDLLEEGDCPVLRLSPDLPEHIEDAFPIRIEPIGDADGLRSVISAIKEQLSEAYQITPCESPALHPTHDYQITKCESPALQPAHDGQFTPCESPALHPAHDPCQNEDPALGFIKDEPTTISEVDYAIQRCSPRNYEDPLAFLESERLTSLTNDEESSSSSGFGRTTVAPIFCPTEKEFQDPLEYYQKIAPIASKFGICKVIAPASFKPHCKTTGLDHISVSVQYPARFYKRWGKGVKEICAIKTYLASHCVYMNKIPVLKGRELNLPAMFRTVQKYGGFLEVSNQRLWGRIAEELNLFTIPNPDKQLDQLYLKFMLPYDILTDRERDALKANIEAKWQRKQQLLQKRADNPLHMRKVYMCESDESSDEFSADEDDQLREAFRDIEECIKRDRAYPLAGFKKLSERTAQTYFPGVKPSPSAVETLYWKKVLEAIDHDCTHTASVDTSEFGYGFTTDPADPMSQHGWNLKNVRNNNANILRSLGAVVSTTVPILHLGSMFATNCWHRDPHCLPWVEYLHQGHEKIWYGVPEQEDDMFRRAVEKLCPTSVQNKKVWLPSDITMIPPNLLLDEGVALTKLIQRPGEFIFVFPKAYSSSICTDFSISESVYFAVDPWQMTMPQVFKELRESCEPMNFSPEQLLIAIARDERVSRDLLHQIYPALVELLEEELQSRSSLFDRGVPQLHVARQGNQPYNIREEAECNVCRRPLYLSKVTVKNYKNLKHACPHDAYKILTKLEESPGTSDSCDRAIEFVLETTVTDGGLKRILSTCQKRLETKKKCITN